MRRDDRDDPFDDIFSEIERLMDEMMNQRAEKSATGNDSGFGADTHVDIHETDEKIRVIADLPGVERDDIELKCDGEMLTIGTENARREYDERIDLPVRVDEHSAAATFNNGILEVVFDRADGSASIDL